MADAGEFLDSSKPRLCDGVRMHFDKFSGQYVLLFPEAVVELKGPGAVIVSLCDGRRSAGEIIAELSQKYHAPVEVLQADVTRYLQRLREKMLVSDSDAQSIPIENILPTPTARFEPILPRPMGLIAEVTYKCPLHCPYCSNPTNYPACREELSTDDWRRVLHQAADIGVYHALFSGGEPLARKDLPQLITAAREAGLYTNLITSAIGLSQPTLRSLKDAGLDSVQISFQSDENSLADSIAGVTAHARKLQAARLVREVNLPLTINVVLHRWNIDQVERIIALAEDLGARRLELANTQFYGWAFRNRESLLPTRQQIERAASRADAARSRLAGKMQLLYVMPDYFSDRPKPCMNGWGMQYISVNPVGDVLPCPTAFEIPRMHFENVREHDLRWIWTQSESFNRFRGTAWMPQPCRSCDQREIDFGGCRCQAALLTGDASNTDPACSLSPQHEKIVQLVGGQSANVRLEQLLYRTNPV